MAHIQGVGLTTVNTRFTVGGGKWTFSRHTFRAESPEFAKGPKDTSLANDY